MLIAGNRIIETEHSAVDVIDPLRGAADILIVNNTLLGNRGRGLGIWDDHEDGKYFMECKNVRFQNNLVLGHTIPVDMFIRNHRRGIFNGPPKRGDVGSLLENPEWHLSFNWHESLPPDPNLPVNGAVIPPGPEDHLQTKIEVLAKPSHPDFLRPSRGSPLATGGAGGRPASPSAPQLPAYVGAVPPKGTAAWDWRRRGTVMVP